MIDDKQLARLTRLLEYAKRKPALRGRPELLNEAESAIADRDYWRLRLLCEQVWPRAHGVNKRVILKVWKILGLKVTL